MDECLVVITIRITVVAATAVVVVASLRIRINNNVRGIYVVRQVGGAVTREASRRKI